MKKLTLLLTAAVLTYGLVACSDKSTDAPALIETKELPTIDMVATHAIDLDISVSQLTFVPNSTAPWLGRIILMDEAGHLYSTDIEGRDPKPVGSGTYIDIFGLARENAAGVFLAITGNKKIEAFIKSDDDGNFSPMIYSGENIDALSFDLISNNNGNSIKILDNRGKFYTVKIVINSKVLEATIIHSAKSITDETSRGTNVASVGSDISGKYFSVITNTFGKSDKNGLIISPLWPTDPLMFKANIKNGLSVHGVDNIKYVASTTSNYGGGAYADGVLALVDAHEDRIVFISMSYAERQLLKAVNPPEEVPQ